MQMEGAGDPAGKAQTRLAANRDLPSQIRCKVRKCSWRGTGEKKQAVGSEVWNFVDCIRGVGGRVWLRWDERSFIQSTVRCGNKTTATGQGEAQSGPQKKKNVCTHLPAHHQSCGSAGHWYFFLHIPRRYLGSTYLPTRLHQPVVRPPKPVMDARHPTHGLLRKLVPLLNNTHLGSALDFRSRQTLSDCASLAKFDLTTVPPPWSLGQLRCSSSSLRDRRQGRIGCADGSIQGLVQRQRIR